MRKQLTVYTLLAFLGISECSAYDTPLTKENLDAQLQELDGDQSLTNDQNPAVGLRYRNTKEGMEKAKAACSGGQPECEELLSAATSSLEKLLGTKSQGPAVENVPAAAPSQTELSIDPNASSRAKEQYEALNKAITEGDSILEALARDMPTALVENPGILEKYNTNKKDCAIAYQGSREDINKMTSCLSFINQNLEDLRRLLQESADLKAFAETGIGSKMPESMKNKLRPTAPAGRQ